MLKEQRQLIDRIADLPKNDNYKKWITDVICLNLTNPKDFYIGFDKNCTIYKYINEKKVPIAYLMPDNHYNIAIRDEDQSGNEMSFQHYERVTKGFELHDKVLDNRKLFTCYVITDKDAEILYNNIINL